MTEITTPAEFLQWLRPGGPWSLSSTVPDSGKFPTRIFTDPDEVATWVKLRDGKENMYFAVNPLRPEYTADKKATKADVAALEFLHVDVDHLGDEHLARLHEHEPSVIIMSGGGYNVLWRLAEPVPAPDDGDWSQLEGYNRHLENLFSADACHNVDRVLRLPFTVNLPNAKKRANGREPVVSEILLINGHVRPLSAFQAARGDPGEPSDTPPGGNSPTLPEVLPEINVDELPVGDEIKRLIRSGDASAYKGDRSTLVFKVAVDLWKAEVEREVIGAVLLDPSLGVSAHCLSKGNLARRAAERAINSAHIAVTTDFERTQKGVVRKDVPENIRLALTKMNIDLKYDELNQMLVINGKMVERDSNLTTPRLHVADNFGFLPSKDLFYDVLIEAAENAPFHPIRDYLDGLVWDEEPRLDDWLELYLGVTPSTEYTRAVGRLWLVAAVRRVRSPGCKFDEMIVLEGKQGTEKSTALEVLACGEEWFTDDLPFRQDSKIFIERCTGKWIIEFSEMSGIKVQQVEAIKAMLSRHTDRARLAYERGVKHAKRSCVFAGTTNDNHYLKDKSGDRRFWPVQTGVIDIAALKRDRDQLWAEAAAAESEGESIRLDPALWDAAAVEQKKRRGAADPWEDELHDIQELSPGPTKVKAQDLWRAVGVEKGWRTKALAERMLDIMEGYGFISNEKATIDGKSFAAYTKDKHLGEMTAVKWVTDRDEGHWISSTVVSEPAQGTLSELDDPGAELDEGR